MGGDTYQKPASLEESVPKERTVGDKFVTWLNGVEFKDDVQMTVALFEIRDECEVRLAAMEEDKNAAKAESEGSAP